MKKIRTVMIEPRKEPYVKWLDLSITAFDEAVSKGCGFKCHAKAKKLKKNIYILYAEENTSLLFAANRRINEDIISGVFYIVKAKKGLVSSLSDRQAKKYIAMFEEPDEFTEDELLTYCLDSIYKDLDNLHFEEL